MIRIITLQFGNLPYFEISAEINRRYCERHHVEWIVAGPVEGRVPYWSKIPAVLAALNGVDAVLYLDADAVLVDHTIPPNKLLSGLSTDKMMMVGEDHQAGVANTGAWLIRNDARSIELLKYWDEVPLTEPRWNTEWPLDEGAFNAEVLPRFRDIIDFRPRKELDWVRGPYIRHYMADTPQRKYRLLSFELELLNKSSV